MLELVPKFIESPQRKATQKKVIYAKRNGGPGRQHGCLAAFWQVAFKFTPTPALPRCLSNKINTSLRSKEKSSTRNLMQSFHLWFALVCSITHYGKCPCVGELSPVTLTYCKHAYIQRPGMLGRHAQARLCWPNYLRQLDELVWLPQTLIGCQLLGPKLS